MKSTLFYNYFELHRIVGGMNAQQPFIKLKTKIFVIVKGEKNFLPNFLEVVVVDI